MFYCNYRYTRVFKPRKEEGELLLRIFGNDIQVALFDKDGTLIDFPSIWIPWLQDIYNYLRMNLPNCFSLNDLRKAFGVSELYETVDPEGPLAIANLEESKTIVAHLLYQSGIPWYTAVHQAYESITNANQKQNHSNYIKPIPGIKELLTKFKKEHVRLGVLTADETGKAWNHLRRVKIADYFDFVIGSDQVKNGKPYPDMVYLAVERYRFELSKTIVIGDTNADMQLGKNAGVKLTVGITTNPAYQSGHLEDADYIIQSFDELF